MIKKYSNWMRIRLKSWALISQQARRDLKESVWRTYKNLALLGKDNQMRLVDLGLIHSSAAPSMLKLILNRLIQDGDITDGISAAFLSQKKKKKKKKNWPVFY